jgi:hypothetical protein
MRGPATPKRMMAAAATQPGGDDGIDGVVVDHYFPDPNNPGMLVAGTFMQELAQEQAAQQKLVTAAPARAPASAPATTARPGIARTARITAAKKPNPRIEWLIKKHNLPQQYHAKNDAGADADHLIEAVFHKVDNAKLTFGISPGRDQYKEPHANVKHWLQMRWCHYFMPELYLHPQQFANALKKWQNENVPEQPTGPDRKPLIIPVLYTAAVQLPDSTGSVWDAADIEDEIPKARTADGHVHFSQRALRPRVAGGPDDAHNVGEHVKGGLYAGRAEPKPSTPEKPPKPRVTHTITGVSWTVTGAKVRHWRVSLRNKSSGNWEPANKRKLTDNTQAADPTYDYIRVEAVDHRNSISDPAEEPLP